ncbi:hypothetical protein [Nocardioides deserti]|uniref:Uncharacterized protein n=1 Tax=Nocardioides deserti TaxID=1588644 RepID=A0ABR6UAV2_9ACTN|nr:hypothetical protein [Nocardioides deserti]MBC2961581.1 hypothetical protein [Nocardioides deserti]GGO78099.1 hypothetical protein GCM10012276_34710 [Nocardioides deserti]
MPATFGDVRLWRAAPLGTAGDGLKSDADGLEHSRDTLAAQAVPDSWTGFARFMAEGRRRLLLSRIDAHVAGKRAVQRALYAAEDDVSEIERLVTDVETTAQAQEFALGDDGSVTDTSTPPTFDDPREAQQWTSRRTQLAQALADDITVILGKAAAVDALLSGSIPSGHVEAVDERGVPSPEVAEEWATMTDDERRAFIEEYIEEYAEMIGIDTPELVWEPESWGPNGQARDGGATIALNERLLDDPQIINTLAHEMRHAHQFEAIDDLDAWRWPWQDDPFDHHEDLGVTEEEAETWRENFKDYQDVDADGWDAYYGQPVEVDAREEGREELEDLTREELERLAEEGAR